MKRLLILFMLMLTVPVLALSQNSAKIYKSVEQMPQFPGGDAALMKYIQSHLNYPAGSNQGGRVILQFVVNPDGSIGEVKVVRSIDAALDKEAIRLVKSLPKFTPGRQNGQPVAVWYTLPVSFKPQAGRQDYPDYNVEVNQVDLPQDTTVYNRVEQMPQFPGGDAALMKYLISHINLKSIPDDGHGIRTLVVIQFVVDKEGQVRDVKVVRSAGKELDAEAVRVVKSLPKFTPGRQNGQPVAVWYTLPVTFDFNNN